MAADELAEELRAWCELASEAAYVVRGQRNTCVLTSHALAAFLRDLDLEAEVFRAEAHVFSNDQAVSGCSLGWDGDGRRRPAAGPGMWHGHLAVHCGGYVLDPTIDQAEVGGKRIAPAVFAKPTGWDEGTAHCWTEDGLNVRHQRYRRQVGWKSAGDSRPSHWREVVECMEWILQDCPD